jgi:hypothetical protein
VTQTEAGRSVEIGVTRPAWLLTATAATGTVSRIVAPGNRLIGVVSLAIGYGWAHWRWNQRD